MTQPSVSAASGVAFTTQPVIQLRDASNNVVSEAGVVVTVAIASGGGTLGGTLTAMTDASGVASFTDLAITGTVGDRTLEFTAPGLASVSSSDVEITAGEASEIVVSVGDGQSATVGTGVAVAPGVVVQDGSGNPVSGVTVVFTVVAGGGSVVPSGGIVTGADGVAAVSGWTLGTAVGLNSLSASVVSDPVLSVTFSATGVADEPAQLVIVTEPLGGLSGGLLSVQPVIEVRDVHGNVVLSDSSTVVTVSIAAGEGGSLSGALSATATNGIVGFSEVSLAGIVATDYVVRFSADRLPAVESEAMQVTPGAASAAVSTLTLTPGSDPMLADGRSTARVDVTLFDAQGNRLDRGGDMVELSSTTGSLASVIDAGQGAYSSTFTAGTEPGTVVVIASVNGVPLASAASLELIEATAVIELVIEARLAGDASAAFGVLPEVLPGQVIEVRVTFTHVGSDIASDIVVVVDLPAPFRLRAAAEADAVAVVCPSLASAGDPPAATVAVGRLVAAADGLRMEVPVDEVCGRSEFWPGESGWVRFSVLIQ
jgi:adhesin/invasin